MYTPYMHNTSQPRGKVNASPLALDPIIWLYSTKKYIYGNKLSQWRSWLARRSHNSKTMREISGGHEFDPHLGHFLFFCFLLFLN